MFKTLNEKVKKLEDEKSQLLQKSQKQEESISYMKKEFDGVWKNLMEKEKEFREYQKGVLKQYISLKFCIIKQYISLKFCIIIYLSLLIRLSIL